MNHNLIVYVSPLGKAKALEINLLPEFRKICPEAVVLSSAELDGKKFSEARALIFIGAMGICVRTIAPFLKDKKTDPAVINIDSTLKFVTPVISGHIGGANELAARIARLTGAIAVITTQSDNTDLWPLDLLAGRFGWDQEIRYGTMNEAISAFVNGKPVALLTECNDPGTEYLCGTLPGHVMLFRDREILNNALQEQPFGLIIIVSPYIFDLSEKEPACPVLSFFPRILHLGVGCRKECDPSGITEYIEDFLTKKGLSVKAVRSLSTIELKKEEPLLYEIVEQMGIPEKHIYSAEELKNIDVPSPSRKVQEVTDSPSVSEASAVLSSDMGRVLIPKQKGRLSEGNDFTFAVAIEASADRNGHIEIVGAGPGDPELVSVRGKRMLQKADLILYAGSLVPEELTFYAKPGATVRNSASMDLEEQFDLMKSFYDRGKFVVRLHTGDPCIYGAIQEQMNFFDRHGMSYRITPGISSFQAAAAALKSQFTIPEKVQTIILTRGEGRTPMPEKEKLRKLAQSQSTMCIFLSAAIAEEVQRELLTAYPPDTPVAACYHLTWKDEKIYRGKLEDLAKIVSENNLTLTTMLVIGEAIDNREGLSRLYSHSFKHLFRP